MDHKWRPSLKNILNNSKLVRTGRPTLRGLMSIFSHPKQKGKSVWGSRYGNMAKTYSNKLKLVRYQWDKHFLKCVKNLSWWPPVFHLLASEKIQTSFPSITNILIHSRVVNMRGWIKKRNSRSMYWFFFVKTSTGLNTVGRFNKKIAFHIQVTFYKYEIDCFFTLCLYAYAKYLRTLERCPSTSFSVHPCDRHTAAKLKEEICYVTESWTNWYLLEYQVNTIEISSNQELKCQIQRNPEHPNLARYCMDIKESRPGRCFQSIIRKSGYIRNSSIPVKHAKSAKSNDINLRKLSKTQFLGQLGPFWDQNIFLLKIQKRHF